MNELIKPVRATGLSQADGKPSRADEGPNQANTKPYEANARSSKADGAPFGPKEDPLRLTDGQQTRAIQIDKGLYQTDTGLTQAILSQIRPTKVGKGSYRVNIWPSVQRRDLLCQHRDLPC